MPSTLLLCTQCGGELHPDEGQVFITCPYCNAAVYVDTARVVFHKALRPTLSAEQADAALRRWMSGSQTVKDLDRKATLSERSFQYFPLWYFRWQAQGKEQTALQLAAASSVTELAHMRLPAGDLQQYDPALDAQAAAPSVPLEAAVAWLQQSQNVQPELNESILVHVPIYIYKYQYQNQTFTAVVEAATGGVLANLYPAKAEAPYIAAGCLTAAIYLALALVPLFGALVNDGAFQGVTIVVALALALLVAPFLYGFAVWVASKR